VVKDAKEKGYTEPDPREDLSGAMAFLHPARLFKTCALYKFCSPWLAYKALL